MKKVGIMTFHASHNNGSMLQALAFQTVLERKYDLPVEIINFSNAAQQNMYAPLPKANNIRRVVKKMIFATNYAQMKKQHDAFNRFAKTYFHTSKESFAEADELAVCEGRYQGVIVGSDQIWNIKCLDADDAYYLNFMTDTPKYTYAVSFGANNPFEQEEHGHYEKLIRKFRHISVRENNAKKWIKEATGIEAEVCLDPTMLLSRAEWESLVDVGAPVIKGDYIFYYCFSLNEKIQKFLKQVSKKYGMPVYILDAKEWTLKTCWRNGIRLAKEYGPDVYINMVKNAKLFITTSFHGTAFATLFEKCFWYLDDGGNDPGKDDRALTFLTQLKLMDRYKTIPELLDTNLLQNKDYTETKSKLEALQQRSFAYLDMVVKELKNEQ